MKTIIKATLGFSNLSPEGKVIKAQSMKDGMQGSGNFAASSMPITYPAIQTIITNLHTSIVTANNGTTTDTSFMHEQERILVSAFNFIKAHVEFVANHTTDAATVIVAAGMQVAVSGGANGVSTLTLDAMGNGTLQVRVPRKTGEKAFVYEYSADGTTWVELTSSSLTKVSLANQTPASTIYVRYYGISKTGKSAYSQSKSAIVL